MTLVVRILWGAIVAALGLLFLLRSRWFIDFLGTFDFLEYKVGPGGTNLAYKITGVILVVAGFLVMTNLWQGFLGASLGAVLPAPRGVIR